MTDDQMDYFTRVTFLRGVLAERRGLIGSIDGFIGDFDTWYMIQHLNMLGALERWLIKLSGK
jgi:hypothetical protein